MLEDYRCARNLRRLPDLAKQKSSTETPSKATNIFIQYWPDLHKTDHMFRANYEILDKSLAKIWETKIACLLLFYASLCVVCIVTLQSCFGYFYSSYCKAPVQTFYPILHVPCNGYFQNLETSWVRCFTGRYQWDLTISESLHNVHITAFFFSRKKFKELWWEGSKVQNFDSTWMDIWSISIVAWTTFKLP